LKVKLSKCAFARARIQYLDTGLEVEKKLFYSSRRL